VLSKQSFISLPVCDLQKERTQIKSINGRKVYEVYV